MCEEQDSRSRTGQRYFDLERHGPDGQDFYLAYLLGRSYAGMRAEDLLVMATLAGTLTTLKGLESGGTVPLHGPIELVAIGEAVVPAMHAAATAPGTLFFGYAVRRSRRMDSVDCNRCGPRPTDKSRARSARSLRFSRSAVDLRKTCAD